MLMLKQAHADNNHEGTEYVRSVLQQEYWIMGLRNALRSIKHQCIQCRKVSAQPLQPQMADFPKERLTGTNHPFQNTGIDYFGPFEVKFLRKTVKYWCCLFTCLTTRAVHIEVVDGLETDACMMAITRFMARRGRPHMFISDNGTNFVGSAREFRELAIEWNQSAIHDQLAHQRIVWKFNPPGAPHFGGVWERLVRSCKKAMYSILGSRCLTLPVLTTTMCLVEQTLNGRPLTPVSHDPEDLEALTPNHFLLGPRVIAQPLIPDASRYVDCRRLYKVAQGYSESYGSAGRTNICLSAMCVRNGTSQSTGSSKLETWYGLWMNPSRKLSFKWPECWKCILGPMELSDLPKLGQIWVSCNDLW